MIFEVGIELGNLRKMCVCVCVDVDPFHVNEYA